GRAHRPARVHYQRRGTILAGAGRLGRPGLRHHPQSPDAPRRPGLGPARLHADRNSANGGDGGDSRGPHRPPPFLAHRLRGAARGAGMTAEYDVIVAGAGPAGALTAGLLARAGVRVALLDKAAFPRDKACGEYTSPQTEVVLARAGALPYV